MEIFGGGVRVECARAEGNHTAPEITDRKGDAVPEAVIGDGNILPADQHAGRGHVLSAIARLGQMLLERGAAVGGVAEAEAGTRLAPQAATLQIAAGLRARAGGKLRLEKAASHLEQLI